MKYFSKVINCNSLMFDKLRITGYIYIYIRTFYIFSYLNEKNISSYIIIITRILMKVERVKNWKERLI